MSVMHVNVIGVLENYLRPKKQKRMHKNWFKEKEKKIERKTFWLDNVCDKFVYERCKWLVLEFNGIVSCFSYQFLNVFSTSFSKFIIIINMIYDTVVWDLTLLPSFLCFVRLYLNVFIKKGNIIDCFKLSCQTFCIFELLPCTTDNFFLFEVTITCIAYLYVLVLRLETSKVHLQKHRA